MMLNDPVLFANRAEIESKEVRTSSDTKMLMDAKTVDPQITPLLEKHELRCENDIIDLSFEQAERLCREIAAIMPPDTDYGYLFKFDFMLMWSVLFNTEIPAGTYMFNVDPELGMTLNEVLVVQHELLNNGKNYKPVKNEIGMKELCSKYNIVSPVACGLLSEEDAVDLYSMLKRSVQPTFLQNMFFNVSHRFEIPLIIYSQLLYRSSYLSPHITKAMIHDLLTSNNINGEINLENKKFTREQFLIVKEHLIESVDIDMELYYNWAKGLPSKSETGTKMKGKEQWDVSRFQSMVKEKSSSQMRNLIHSYSSPVGKELSDIDIMMMGIGDDESEEKPAENPDEIRYEKKDEQTDEKTDDHGGHGQDIVVVEGDIMAV